MGGDIVEEQNGMLLGSGKSEYRVQDLACKRYGVVGICMILHSVWLNSETGVLPFALWKEYVGSKNHRPTHSDQRRQYSKLSHIRPTFTMSDLSFNVGLQHVFRGA